MTSSYLQNTSDWYTIAEAYRECFPIESNTAGYGAVRPRDRKIFCCATA